MKIISMETNSIVIDKTRQELKRFVYRRVKDKALADDIVQDIFVKILTRLGQLKDTEKITSWIYQIARNTISDYFRTQSRSIQAIDLDWTSDRQILNDCVSFCLGEMLLTLPEKYKQALELAEIEQVSQLELAQRLQISYSGAKSRVQRARKMLKDKMDEAYVIKTDSYGNVIVCKKLLPCHCPSPESDIYE